MNEEQQPTSTRKELLPDASKSPSQRKPQLFKFKTVITDPESSSVPVSEVRVIHGHKSLLINRAVNPPVPPLVEIGCSPKTAITHKTLNPSGTNVSLSPNFPSLIKIGHKHILPKQLPVSVSGSQTSKPTVTYLGTLVRSDGTKAPEKPQIVFTTTHNSNQTATNPPSFTTTSGGSLLTTASCIPVVPFSKVANKLSLKRPCDTTYLHQNPTRSNVLLPGTSQAVLSGKSKFINIKISNGKIISPSQSIIQSSSPTPSKVSKLQITSTSLNAIKPQQRILSKSLIINDSPKHATDLDADDKAVTQDVASTTVNADLSTCLQEAVNSMFPSMKPTSKRSCRSTSIEDDVILVKVPIASSSNSIIQENRLSTFKQVPDDVRIELLPPQIEPPVPLAQQNNTIESFHLNQPGLTNVTQEIKKEVSDTEAVELHIIDCNFQQKPCSEVPKVETISQDEHEVTELPILGSESTSNKGNEVRSTTINNEETPVEVDNLIVDRCSINDKVYDLQPDSCSSFEIETVIIKSQESILKPSVNKYMQVSSTLSLESSKEVKRTVPSDVLNWRNGVGGLPDSEVKFSFNEFGIIEMVDNDSTDKETLTSKVSEGIKESSISKRKRKDLGILRDKSPISILWKKRDLLIKKEVDSSDSMDDEDSTNSSTSTFQDFKDPNVFHSMTPEKTQVSDENVKKIKKKIKSPILNFPVKFELTDKGDSPSTDAIYTCEECGCFGQGVEFLNANFCSQSCENEWTRKSELKSKKEKLENERMHFLLKKREKKEKLKEKFHPQVEIPEPPSALPDLPESVEEMSADVDPEVDQYSNDSFQEASKSRLPWQTGKNGFSWRKYIEFNKAKAAPVKLFLDPFPYSKNNFKVGMKMEGIDPKHPSYFCVLTVVDVYGYRIKLHFDGYGAVYDFWVNADSMDIFPAGWCEKNSYTLTPPATYDQDTFNWSDYLKHCRAQAAPKNLFYNKSSGSVCPNGFRIGMKLEAVDRHNTALVCVATVAGLMDSRIMVHFDGWDDIYNYWADPSSSYIHPVGWCKEHDHKLTPPHDWIYNEFDWDQYLLETKSSAAPARAFKQRTNGGFRRGMKLECVDKRVPALIRVATVDDVREPQIRIRFDGWSDIYSYWVDEDSRDIHPVGWCQNVGHNLEPPFTTEDFLLECPTKDCHGQGHVSGSKIMTNHTVSNCPFDPQNLIKQEELPDRFESKPDNSIDEPVMFKEREKRLAEGKAPCGRPPKYRRLEQDHAPSVSPVDETLDNPDYQPTQIRFKKKKRGLNKLPKKSEIESLRKEIHQAVINPGYKPCGSNGPDGWAKHSYPLNIYINSVPTNDDVQQWSQEHVMKFVASIPDCQAMADKFLELDIDGEALAMMTQNDFIKYMGFKVGPAVKIFNCILLLRQKIEQH